MPAGDRAAGHDGSRSLAHCVEDRRRPRLERTRRADRRRRQLLRSDGSHRCPRGMRRGAGACSLTVQRRPGRGSAPAGRARRRRCVGRDRQRRGSRAGRSPTRPSAARGTDDAAGRAGARAGGRGARPPPRRTRRHTGRVGRRAGRRRRARRRWRDRARGRMHRPRPAGRRRRGRRPGDRHRTGGPGVSSGDTAGRGGRRPGRCRRRRAGPCHPVRENTPAVRQADRRIPGHQARLGRQLCRAGTRSWPDLRRGRATRRPDHPGRRGLERGGAGQGGGSRGGGRLRGHRGTGSRRVGADLGTRHAPLSAACLAGRLDAGRQPRALPRGGTPLRRERRMTHTELKTDLVAEYAAWLTDFLPNDYYERYREYRWDIGLRRAHQRAAFEAGWLQPTWSPEHGGRSLGLAEAMEIRLEAAMRSAPKLPNVAGPGVAAPGIRQFGTAAQIDRLLIPLLRGDEWWALGMSEPEAGSDFAGLRTRAVRDGDMFRVKGRKIWTTQAHQSRWCTLYARTDPDAPKHRGISCLILDLESPGVTIEPIRMASISDETFCEVILDDVEIRADSLLGPVNGGWQVAMSSLNHERQMIWIMNWVEIQRGLSSVRDSQATHDDYASGEVFAELGSLLADADAIRATGYRALNNDLAGRPSPEADILKLLGSQTLQRVWELSAAAAGPRSIDDTDLLFERQDALAATIYGGTSEIQRNIIAERLLGLPKG